jgi:hypothetical protein
MTLKINSAEGQANGTTVAQGSGGNTGGAAGDYFTQVSPGTGGSIVFSTAQKAHGSNSYLFTPASGQLCFVIFDDSSGSTAVATRFYIYLTGYPAAEGLLMDVEGAAGGAIMSLHLLSSGLVRAHNSAGGVIPGTTATSAIPLNQWVRIEFQGTVSATAAVTWQYFNTMDSGTPTESLTGTGTIVTNSVQAAAGRVIYGRFTASGATPAFYMDDFAQNLQSATALGAYVAPALTGTASVVPSSGNAPLAVSVSITPAGGSGTPINYTYTWGDGATTGPTSSSTATHTYSTPGTYNYDFALQNA